MNSQQVEEFKERFLQSSTTFEIQGGPDGDANFKLLTKPVLNWTNPERRTSAGAVFLWTLNGRPVVAMSTYPTGTSTFENEFQSLSAWPLTSRVAGELVWSPRVAGMETKPIPDAAPPESTRPARLLQMRRLANEFSAQLIPPNKNAIQLRLLATPLYRYPDAEQQKVEADGALFAFVQGTDPEVLVLIESIKVKGQETWHYGLARMTMVPLEISHRDILVQKLDWAERKPTTPYFTYKNSSAVAK